MSVQAFWGEMFCVALCLWSFCVHVCVPDHCLTSNIAELKAQSKCCENKSPRAGTHDHAQDADGAWRHSKCCRTACVCACEVCLKWPCVSSSLEGSRSWVESRPASSLGSCCSVMLLALNTQTHSSVLTAGTSLLDLHIHLKKWCLFLCPGLALEEKGLGGKQVDSVFKINSSGDATFKVWFCWFTLH